MGVAMPTIGLVRQFLTMMKATGRGELDFSGADPAHGRSGRNQGSVQVVMFQMSNAI